MRRDELPSDLPHTCAWSDLGEFLGDRCGGGRRLWEKASAYSRHRGRSCRGERRVGVW